jgi:transposase
MTSSYSEDLRQKAIAAVERGERKTNVSQMFNISRNTLDLWLKRKEELGHCRAITHYQQGCHHKITDWERFREFAKQYGDKTQSQMAKLWGDNVTQQNISDALHKIGYSRKKRLMGTKNAMNSSEKPLRSA